jgi:hypothetical protein
VDHSNGQQTNGWASKLAIAPVGRAINILGSVNGSKGIQSGFYIPSGATCPYRPGQQQSQQNGRLVPSPAGHHNGHHHDQVRPLSGPPAPASHSVSHPPPSPHQFLSRSCASSPLTQDLPSSYFHQQHHGVHQSHHQSHHHQNMAHSNGNHHQHHPLALSVTSQSDYSDSQPLNLSKKCSPPTAASSSPHIKMEA